MYLYAAADFLLRLGCFEPPEDASEWRPPEDVSDMIDEVEAFDNELCDKQSIYR